MRLSVCRSSHHPNKLQQQTPLLQQRSGVFKSQRNFFHTSKILNENQEHDATTNDQPTDNTHDNSNKLEVQNNLTKKLKGPIEISGKRWWFSADPNVSLVRDILNPSIFFTFRDSEGKYLDKVKYTSSIETWGIKPEIGIRNQVGFIPSKTQELNLKEIPDTLTLKGGYDINFGFLHLTRSTIQELGVPFYMFGTVVLPGIGFGFTRVSRGKLQLVPEEKNTAKVANAATIRSPASPVFWLVVLMLLVVMGSNFVASLMSAFDSGESRPMTTDTEKQMGMTREIDSEKMPETNNVENTNDTENHENES
eukprot:gb/GECH01000305.1/.p1 GENE.gb/GECH01000305.1/~~gb/GECH01000305.1/.p1  ORF type:complete len:308 (+),score=63.30 gb/GECH01000305.1/:1-924(+)